MDIGTVLDNVQKVVTIAAVLTAGLWTYSHFIRGRTYKLRLELVVSGTVTSARDGRHLVVTTHLKNVGLSKADIQHEGSALRVLTALIQPCAEDISAVDWNRIGTFSVFDNHGWIESGEAITEQAMFVIPEGEYAPVRLELRIVSRGVEFNSMSIVTQSKNRTEN